MKLQKFIPTVCAAALVAASAFAQNGANLIDVVKFDGKQVKNLQGQQLGQIKQVLVDPQSGRVRYAVLEVDKAMQIQDAQIAVPWGSFKVEGKPEEAKFKLSLDATKEKLQSAPKFKAGDADRLYTKQSAEPIYTYWAIMWLDDPQNTGSGSSTAGNQRQSGSGTSSSSKTQSESGTASSATGTSGSGTTSPGTSGATTTTQPDGSKPGQQPRQ